MESSYSFSISVTSVKNHHPLSGFCGETSFSNNTVLYIQEKTKELNFCQTHKISNPYRCNP